jgi:hypothetical protein
VDPWFRFVEDSALSVWLRESLSLLALPGILTAHTRDGVPRWHQRPLMMLERGDQAPLGARLVGAASLLLWMSILIAGRMEAFFKPLGR